MFDCEERLELFDSLARIVGSEWFVGEDGGDHQILRRVLGGNEFDDLGAVAGPLEEQSAQAIGCPFRHAFLHDTVAQHGGERRGMSQLGANLLVTAGRDHDQLRAEFGASANRVVSGRIAGVQGNQLINRRQLCRGDRAGLKFKSGRANSRREYVGGRHQIRARFHADDFRGNSPQAMEQMPLSQ